MHAETLTRTGDRWLGACALLLVPVGLYFLIQHAFPRLEMTPEAYGEYYWSRRFWLLAHTVGGLAATLIGPLQFMAALRKRKPALHRLLGKVYLVSVGFAAGCAYVLAFTSRISASYEWGLVLGASLWLASGTLAYLAIRQRRIERHRAWMVRNYTVTFFFIAFFAALDLLYALGWTAIETYAGPLVIVCLLVPLAIVELLLRRRSAR